MVQTRTTELLQESRRFQNLVFVFMLGKLNYLLCMLGFLLFFGPQAWHNIRAWVRREQWKRKNRR